MGLNILELKSFLFYLCLLLIFFRRKTEEHQIIMYEKVINFILDVSVTLPVALKESRI